MYRCCIFYWIILCWKLGYHCLFNIFSFLAFGGLFWFKFKSIINTTYRTLSRYCATFKQKQFSIQGHHMQNLALISRKVARCWAFQKIPWIQVFGPVKPYAFVYIKIVQYLDPRPHEDLRAQIFWKLKNWKYQNWTFRLTILRPNKTQLWRFG
jgi:hypothetical protein